MTRRPGIYFVMMVLAGVIRCSPIEEATGVQITATFAAPDPPLLLFPKNGRGLGFTGVTTTLRWQQVPGVSYYEWSSPTTHRSGGWCSPRLSKALR